MPKISLAEWQEHYHNFKKSSLSMGRYAQRNGIPTSSMYSAFNRLKKKRVIKSTEQEKPKFIQLTAAEIDNKTATTQMTSIKVVLPSGMGIELTSKGNGDHAIGFIRSLEQSLREKP